MIPCVVDWEVDEYGEEVEVECPRPARVVK